MGSVTALYRKQRTLRNKVTYSGMGLHTGEVVAIHFHPAEADTGVVFCRADLPNRPHIRCCVDNIRDTARNTTIGCGDVRLHTVEHVLAAIRAYEVDNVFVEVEGNEPPVGNGSSDVFVNMIEQAGIVELDTNIVIRSLNHPVYHTEGDTHLVALPCDRFKVSYTLNYPQNPLLKAQFFSSDVTPEIFKTEIAPCRSFGLYEEIDPLIDRGLIKGCSLANVVVIKDDVVFSKNGLFFPDEMARHKVLDLIGDLSLVGFPFLAHIIAIRSGHASHKTFSKKLCNAFTNGET
ncbi:MAG: UDP-3-O-acyl-N-acetylglucosamine deacetylase [Chlamydiales bacterium]|nr:UDP-3-O-acyl-N-acetylglucosamine deacetylase [Chlamydiales bacterium]